MASPLEEKLQDLTRWTVLACEHQRSGRVEDALTNMRKAGEAAAKIIITGQWPGKRGADAIEDTSFSGLIQLIIRNSLATKPTILLLQTLQVEGNAAAHDNRLKRGRVDLGMASLNELVHWLYVEHLGRSLPTELASAFAPKPTVPAQPSEQRTTNKTDQRQEERIAQLEKHIARLSAMPERVDDGATTTAIAELREELARIRAEDPAPAKQPEAPTPATHKGKAWRIRAAIVAVLLIIGGLVVHQYTTPKPEAEAHKPKAASTPDRTAFNVLLVPPTILQDNPNITIDLVATLNNRLQRRIAERPYVCHVLVDSTHRAATPTAEQAWTLALACGAQLVIYGDLVEPTASDSGTTTLGYVMDRQGHIESADLQACRFRTIADSAVGRLMDECVWLFDRALANRLYAQGDYSRALEVLYSAQSGTPRGELVRHLFMAQCHAILRNDPAALREAQWCMQHSPEDPEVIALLASVYTTLGQRTPAIALFERALAKYPKNANYLLGLAGLLMDPSDPSSANNARAFALVQKAIAADSLNATAWTYAAQANTQTQNWNEAARCYKRALALQPSDLRHVPDLALIEAFKLGRPEVAAQRLTAAIGADSSDPRALFQLAEIYTHTTLNKPAAARKLYAKAKELEPMAQYGAEVGQADAAFQAGDSQSAQTHYAAAWTMDSIDPRIANQYAILLVNAHQDARALQVLQQGLLHDPANHMLHANIGQILAYGPAPLRDLKAAEQHLASALTTDPLDTAVLEQCGNVKLMLGDMDGAEKLLRKAYQLNPDSYGANRGLGLIRDAQGNLEQARKHYEKAIALRPTDDLVASNLAYLLLRVSPRLVPQGLYWAKRSVELNRSPENLVNYANLLQASGQYTEAASSYYEAIKNRPDLRQQELEGILREKGLAR